jgi:hypothetical protein
MNGGGANYIGSSERTFQQAVLGLMESQYKVLGSRRVLEMLAQDIQDLVEQFFPIPGHLTAGWMVFTGTRASGPKAHPGQGGGEHELVTLAWPVLLHEDLVYRATHPDQKECQREWFCQRLIRIIEYGVAQPESPVLLTQSDLSSMLGLTQREVCQLLEYARQSSGKALPTKGYYFDQGRRPTHKDEIIALYEAGVDEAEIAHRANHAQESVGQYIRDYERVKLLCEHKIPLGQIPALSGIQPSVVEAYTKLIAKYHPNLLTAQGALFS